MDALAQLNATLAGRYAIEREIGSGGMATVYLARDLRHSRPVALKVLNPELGAVLGVQRFLSEIRVTANLQHPNLLPLFDSGEADGLLFYVMPFIEGESLRKRLIREKQLPVDEAIHIATAVGAALDYAHRHGVIHRDLKPENILLSESQPLVADFGIALAVSKAGGERITQTGVSLGTPQYMSPEQAIGDRPVDGRTDIYSLGALAYEMLTGDPPHKASTAQAIIAKALTETPQDVRAQRPHVPAHVAAAIERALEKLPADRWHTAQQFAEALQGRQGGVAIPFGVQAAGGIERPIQKRTWRRTIRTPPVVALAIAFTAAVGGFSAWRLSARFGAERSVSFYIDPPAPTGVRENIEAIAISPDGHTVAFVSQSDSSSQVYLRRLSEVQARPLPGTNGAAQVAFSPDGKWLAILTFSGRLLKVAVDGSSVLSLAEIQEFYAGLAWESTRAILFGGAAVAGRGIGRIAATGGTPRPVTKPPPAWGHARPLVTGDAKTLLFVDWGPGFIEDDFLAIGSLETGEYTRTSLLAAAPLGVVDNWIVYDNSAGAIAAAPFDARSRRTTGDPVRVMEDVTITGAQEAALSPSGTLVYKRGQPRQRLVLVDPAGGVHQVTAEERNFLAFFGVGRPTLSPDGRRVAVTLAAQRGDSITVDIWTIDRHTGTFARLTSLGDVVNPEWTPDGKHLVFSTWESRRPKLWRQLADGTEPAETLLTLPDGYRIIGANVTPDGSGITYCAPRIHVASRADLFYLALAGDRKPERLDVGPLAGFPCAARVSPDGRWLAYVGSDEATTNVYVRSFRGAAGPVQISADGGDSPVWSRDGKRLYYRRIEAGLTSGSLVVAHVSPTTTGLHVVKRERIMTLREGGVYDVAPDGRQVLVVQQGDSRVQLVVTTNWTSQLRARLAGVK